jgi:Tfp pilus assembly protein PilZ
MASSGTNERLRIQFESSERLRDEFEKNISNGGIFVPSQGQFTIRESVTVEIELGYSDAEGTSISLDGEVVHQIPPEMAPSGAIPGVAIQFSATAKSLRECFEPLLGAEIRVAPPDYDDVKDGAGQVRRAKRRSVRVPIRVMPESSPPFEATSRDLSATGILLSRGKAPLPKGEVVRICLWHPNGEQSVEIDGIVVREVKNKTGQIAAVAVAFDRSQAAERRVSEVIEALSQAGHRSKLGGVSGSIADLGLANLLQMFGSSAPRGTVVCEHGGEQGWVAFAEGDLLMAELGAVRGHDALVAMLDWGDGRFEFEANADEKLVQSADRKPLAAAILDAICSIDERDEARRGDDDSISGVDRSDASGTRGADGSVVSNGDASGSVGVSETGLTCLGPETVFSVDRALEESTRMVLGKVELAVLDLAKSGLMVRKIMEIVPDEKAAVYRALEELVESGVLELR